MLNNAIGRVISASKSVVKINNVMIARFSAIFWTLDKFAGRLQMNAFIFVATSRLRMKNRSFPRYCFKTYFLLEIL